MSTQLTLIETPDFEADRIAQENQLIDEALHILDRRLFTRGPNLTSPDTVASYLKLHLVQQEHDNVPKQYWLQNRQEPHWSIEFRMI